MTMKVGITGGIGSGKTTVCKIFQVLDVPVYNADIRAKWLMNTDEALIKKIKNLFGEKSYDEQGQLNRKYIASQVFENKEKLEKLNSIVHPAVKEDFESWVEAQESDYVIKEAALLFETGSYKQMDYNVLVTAPLAVRIKRVMMRDGVDEQSVLARVKNQLDDEEKAILADYIIVNDNRHSLVKEVFRLHKLFLDLSKSK